MECDFHVTANSLEHLWVKFSGNMLSCPRFIGSSTDFVLGALGISPGDVRLNRRFRSPNGYIFRETNFLFLQYRSSLNIASGKCFMGCTHDLLLRHRTLTLNTCSRLIERVN